MSRLKLLTLIGTRPETIKLSLTIAEADRHFDQVLVHTGQNYDFELNEVFFRDLGIRPPNHFLDAGGGSPAQTIARVIERLDPILEVERPDALLILGDTNSCLGAIAAKRRKIPIFHMEAGNRCFDQRVPEEINRRIVDHLSDVNLTYTEHARRYLLNEGIPADRIIMTGTPMTEVLHHFHSQIEESVALQSFGVEKNGFILVSAHREENVDDEKRLRNLIEGINSLCQRWALPVLFSTHPRTRARLDAISGFSADPLLRFVKPVGFFDYVKLQKSALCVVSDSGTLTEECAILGLPGVMIREAHERPEGMDEAIVLRSDLGSEGLLAAVEMAVSHAQSHYRFTCPAGYEPSDVSRKVARIILSYTGYVNRTVWSKKVD